MKLFFCGDEENNSDEKMLVMNSFTSLTFCETTNVDDAFCDASSFTST